MQILKVDLKNPDKKVILKAAQILKTGGLIVYPTDTAYGLGANALNKEVVKKIYDIKGRDFSKPTHVVARDWKMIAKLAHSDELVKKLFVRFLPGPLTLILKKKEIVPDILTASYPTVGIRFPNCNVTKQISALVDFPYTTPSANKSGGKTPYSIDEVAKELDIQKTDLVLDAGLLPRVLPSTIIDLSIDPPKIIREGPISKKEILKALVFSN